LGQSERRGAVERLKELLDVLEKAAAVPDPDHFNKALFDLERECHRIRTSENVWRWSRDDDDKGR
jgi:hypothetical protein